MFLFDTTPLVFLWGPVHNGNKMEKFKLWKNEKTLEKILRTKKSSENIWKLSMALYMFILNSVWMKSLQKSSWKIARLKYNPKKI